MQSEVNDKFFGVLIQDPPDYHIATVAFSPGKVIEVTINTEAVEDDGLSSLLETAHATFVAIQAKSDIILRAIVDELFPNPKNGWAAGLITEEKFLAGLRLDNIEIWQDGASNVNYAPKGLEEFVGDHFISVRINSEGNIRQVGFVW